MTSDAVVIVGAGHAGFQLALALRQNSFSGAIRLINSEPHLPYQRPPLSKAYLKGAGGADSLHFRPAAFFTDQRIEIVAGEAVGINRTARSVRLASGESLDYAHLVLATGARNRLLQIDGVGDDLHYIRSLKETERLRLQLGDAKRVAVIGAGFIGLEFAATARAKGLEVDVIELAPRVMARAVTADISRFFQQRHEQAGMRFHFGVGVAAIERSDGAIAALILSNGQRIGVDSIVVGIGVLPNTEIAAEAGLEIASGIVVDQHLRTADPDISAIGDCAVFPSPHAPRLVRIESVQNATDQARCVAARLCGKAAAYDALPWFWSDQGSDKLQIVGLTEGADLTVVRGSAEQGSFSMFCYRNNSLVGIESVNRGADHVLGRKLLGMGRSVSPDHAADLTFDLKSALT